MAGYCIVAALIAASYPYMMLKVTRRELASLVSERLASGAQVGASEIEGWMQSIRMQAITLAEVAANSAALVPLDSLANRGSFSSAWILSDSNTIAKTHGAIDHPPLTVGPHIIKEGDGFFIDYAAKAGRKGSPLVITRNRISAETFHRLNPTAYARTRTTRSTILWPQPDSVYVILTSSRQGAAGTPRAYARSSLPVMIREVISNSSARGYGAGIGGMNVYYASTTVQSLGIPLVRQVEPAEVVADAKPGLVLQGILLAGLILSLVMLAESRWNAAQMRREQQVAKLRDDFVSSVSHELRTPLAQIRIYAELLRQGSMEGKEDKTRALYVIEKEARRLTILVDNILSFAHLRRKSEALITKPSNIAEDVGFVIEAFSPLAAERGITVACDIEEELFARVDSFALRQILLNLLENAAKYGPRNQAISIWIYGGEQKVRIAIDDQGPGIPLDERDRIWEPFYRGDAATSSDTPGSGIGLSVVRDLVTRHDGEVSVTESSSGGARFVLSFDRVYP